MRRRLAMAIAVLLVAGLAGPGALPAQELEPGGTFTDDDGNVHEGNIEAIAAQGITLGCGPELYCPSDIVSRGQMAAFINRAVNLPAATQDHFSDDDGSVFEDDINRLAEAGVTLGCDPTGNSYCPDGFITRGQMAAFLVRAYGYTEGAGSDAFDDDDSSVFESEIERLAEAGVTAGCSSTDPRLYCPLDDVRRDQMASFLARAQGLTPIFPPARCSIFPSNNIWNRRVDDLPLDSRSAAYVASIGSGNLHPDFGSGVFPAGSDSPIGIPFVEVDGTQTKVDVNWTAYGDESDDGPYPIPPDAPVEGGQSSSGDRHVIVVDTDNCVLYETFSSFPNGDGSWDAANGAVFDLRSNNLRPDTWTSADAAGLPIYPGLVRYDEVAAGTIEHAIRFTAAQTQSAYVWPARHEASSITDLNVPPMGQRFRMRADFDISGFDPQIQVILTAFKEYGLILADNGSDWFISGAPDERWDNDLLNELKTIPGSAFEAVDVSGLIVDPDSAEFSG